MHQKQALTFKTILVNEKQYFLKMSGFRTVYHTIPDPEGFVGLLKLPFESKFISCSWGILETLSQLIKLTPLNKTWTPIEKSWIRLCHRTYCYKLDVIQSNMTLYLQVHLNQHLSHLMTKPTKWLCAQRRLRSAWASAHSDQSSLCAKWVAKDPSFLHADSESSESLLGTHIILLVLSWGGSFVCQNVCLWSRKTVSFIRFTCTFSMSSTHPELSVNVICSKEISSWRYWKHKYKIMINTKK